MVERRFNLGSLCIAGKHIIKGSSNNDFHSYMPLEISKERFEEVRNELMVNFDPTRCYVEDLKVRFQFRKLSQTHFTISEEKIITKCIFSLSSLGCLKCGLILLVVMPLD